MGFGQCDAGVGSGFNLERLDACQEIIIAFEAPKRKCDKAFGMRLIYKPTQQFGTIRKTWHVVKESEAGHRIVGTGQFCAVMFLKYVDDVRVHGYVNGHLRYRSLT